MASDYEAIEYDIGEVKELFDSCIFVGTITEIKHNINKASVDTEKWGTISDIPIHYHCEKSETVDDGHFAFEENDQVYILHDGSHLPPSSSTSKIVGFVIGLKECVRKVYLRPKIDGNSLRSGGQYFKLRYHKRGAPDIWREAVTKEDYPAVGVAVRGKWDGTEQDKYGYGEKPLYLYEWDGGEIQIVLFYERQKDFVDFPGDPPYYDDEGRPFVDINVAMTGPKTLYAFSAVAADSNGDYMGIKMCNYLGFPGSALYPTTVNGTTVDLTRHVEICSALIDPGDPSLNNWEFTGCWLTDIIQCPQCYTYAASSLGAQKFTWCRWISKTFTAEEAAVLMENREGSIYNWGSEEYETNQIVLAPNILFNLVETLLDQPPRSIAPYDWHFCGPYVDCEVTEQEIGRTINPTIFVPIIFDWVHEGGNTPVGGSEVAGTCTANCTGGGLFRGAKDPNKGIERLNGIGFTADWESLLALYEGKALRNKASTGGAIMALTPHDSMDLTLSRTAGCTECLYKMEPLPEAHFQYRY